MCAKKKMAKNGKFWSARAYLRLGGVTEGQESKCDEKSDDYAILNVGCDSVEVLSSYQVTHTASNPPRHETIHRKHNCEYRKCYQHQVTNQEIYQEEIQQTVDKCLTEGIHSCIFACK